AAASVQTPCPSATPSAVASPLRRPPESALRIVRAVSWPGVQMTTAATRRKPASSAMRRAYACLVETGLSGKGVLVTGASGGIGAACARAFAAEGARVAVHYHRGEERAREVAVSVDGAPTIQADLTDELEVDRLFEEARAALGRVDVCAAVAGVWPQQDVPVWELPLERWEQTLRQNLTTAFLTARGFLREVERNGHGSLVLIGSTAGIVGGGGA